MTEKRLARLNRWYSNIIQYRQPNPNPALQCRPMAVVNTNHVDGSSRSRRPEHLMPIRTRQDTPCSPVPLTLTSGANDELERLKQDEEPQKGLDF